jgi:NAD(P)-dependent dehydrogenase (short-subunit alcohol dehydrogenase family)
MTGSSSGFGVLSAGALADAGYTVYDGIRDTAGRNADQVGGVRQYAAEHRIDLHTVELDVSAAPALRARAVAGVVRDSVAAWDDGQESHAREAALSFRPT